MTADEVKEMLDVIESVSPSSLLILLVVFGFAPVFTVRLFVHLYPPNHPRRHELIAELYKLKRIPRVFYATEVIATAVLEASASGSRQAVLSLEDSDLFESWLWRNDRSPLLIDMQPLRRLDR
jgi:hypothetical protein